MWGGSNHRTSPRLKCEGSAPTSAMRRDGEATMPERAALQAAKDQLAYWRRQCDEATKANDPARVAECKRFLAQCELMVSVLTDIGNRK